MRSLSVLVFVFGSAACQWAHQSDTTEGAAAERSWGPEDDGSYRPELYESDGQSNWHGGSHDDGSYRPEHHEGPWNDHSWTPQQQPWTHPAHHQWAHPAHHQWAPQQWSHPAHDAAPQQWAPQQWSHPAHDDAPQKKWTGPFAHSPGFDKNGAPLQVLDTPEVAAEKSKHFHLYAHGAYAGAVAHQQ